MLICASCHAPTSTETKVSIHLSKDSQTVCISGLEYSILHELKQDSLTQENWQGIFPIYHMPADTDMKDLQPEQPGKYQITDSLITFKPDTPFKKQQQYFARFYGNGTNFSTGSLIRNKSNLKGQSFKEVVFKFNINR